MKWFQHYADSHSNPKVRNLIRQKGCEGYGFLQICREIVCKYGEKYRLKPEKCWKNLLIEASLLEESTIDELLLIFAENKDIDCKSLEKGDLYIPQMKEYASNWEKRLQSNYGVTTAIDKITLDKIRLHYITLKGWLQSDLSKDDYARMGKAIKGLFVRANKDSELVCRAISWVSQQGYEWTLETALKKFPDFLRAAPSKEKLEAEKIYANLPKV